MTQQLQYVADQSGKTTAVIVPIEMWVKNGDSVHTRPSLPDQPVLQLHLEPIIELTREQFFQFCQINRDLRIERTAEGDLEIMSPSGGETGARNLELARIIGNWARKEGNGITFDSSTGFELPDGSVRSPDIAWIQRSRLAILTAEQKKQFLPLCPDFVIELRSLSDSLSKLQEKMEAYLESGLRLGWLIDPASRTVWVYRPETEVVELKNPVSLSGEAVLPDLGVPMKTVWQPDF